ncbi:DUF421 domain-containing protein [Peptoniphilus stercorisuis]|uniref:Uncharacterized membrane protein YcaP (DUF421 family) n=1 Tax=Peptoniphilus stercorisuis TaxID=1436965 RepID=A0ABS4KE81_9FIRM|nr:YetF domain-containing protein [Peptoniphilus stercorisuis]MBP2026068.1 uncharacterized membrane protein YcaP (DUF421 family) [Peptoniphilus stercorisuis]
MDFKFMTIKLISAFIIILIYIKISGRKQLAPISPSDQISNMVIGGLMGNTIVSRDVSVFESTIIVLIWAFLQILIRHLKYRSGTITELLDGKRYMLMKDGVLLPEEFKKAKLSIMDFENNIHSQDVKSISEIRNAWFDPSGNITIDLKEERSQSNVLVFNGNIHKDTLNQLNIKEEDLKNILSLHNYKNIEELLCVEYYKKNIYVYTVNGNEILKME